MVRCAERRSRTGRRAATAALVTGLLLGCGTSSALASPGHGGPPPPRGGGALELAVPTLLDRPAAYPSVPVGTRTYFVGDYDTNGYGQWDNCQSVVINSACTKVKGNHYSMGLKPTPGARQGPFASRFEVRPGDKPNFGGGERSEVASSAPGALVHDGDERWYQWSMYLPPDFPTPRGEYFITMQWHANNTSSPPLAVLISKKGTVDIGGDGVDAASRKPRTIGAVQRGKWVDYVMHVGFSRDAKKGYVEAWQDGKLTVPRAQRATMTTDESYLKQGIYRNADGSDAVVWLDGLRVTGPAARSLEPAHYPALCSDDTPRGTPCTPPN